MHLHSAVAILLLQQTGLGLAAPRIDDGGVKKGKLDETWKQFSREDFCNKFKDDGEGVWKELGVGKWFDSWLDVTDDKDRWTELMDWEVNRNARSSIVCQTVDDLCEAPSDCFFHYDQGMGPAYWVLYSTSLFHAATSYLRRELFEGSYGATLGVDKMVRDFSVGSTAGSDISAVAVLSGAFTMAAGAAVASNPAAGPLTVIAGVFGLMGAFGGDDSAPDLSIDIEQQTYHAYDVAIESVDDLLRKINSPPAPDKSFEPKVPHEHWQNEEVLTQIPGQEGDYSHALTRFYAEGKYLDSHMVDEIKKMKDEYIRRHQQAISAEIIKQLKYVITVSTNINNAADCGGDSDWFEEATGRCFRTFWQEKQDEMFLDLCNTPTLTYGADPLVLARDEYGMNIEDFYRNSFECADKHRDGSGKPKAGLNPQGTLPECFFNVPVVVGNISPRQGTQFADVSHVEWNTAGFTGDCQEPNAPVPFPIGIGREGDEQSKEDTKQQ